MRRTALWVGLLLSAQYGAVAQTATTTLQREREANATSEPEFVPMTQRERWKHYFRSTGDPMAMVMSAAGAGITQWQDNPTEWGQGATGYTRRLGNTYAQHIIRQTLIFGASSALHEDNRYLQSGESGVGDRIKYAIGSTFLARRNDGSRRFAFSRFGATMGTAFISRRWQPRSQNSNGNALSSFGIAIGAQAGFNVAREFLPSIFHDGPR
jgi:hypothetical protein